LIGGIVMTFSFTVFKYSCVCFSALLRSVSDEIG